MAAPMAEAAVVVHPVVCLVAAALMVAVARSHRAVRVAVAEAVMWVAVRVVVDGTVVAETAADLRAEAQTAAVTLEVDVAVAPQAVPWVEAAEAVDASPLPARMAVELKVMASVEEAVLADHAAQARAVVA